MDSDVRPFLSHKAANLVYVNPAIVLQAAPC
jgi:hypothetical protein